VDVDHWGWLRFGRGVWLRRGDVWDVLKRLFRDGGAKIKWQIDVRIGHDTAHKGKVVAGEDYQGFGKLEGSFFLF
jgi:hypothetical protein